MATERAAAASRRTAETVVVRPGDYDAVAAFMAGFPGVRERSVAAWRNRLAAWWDLNPAFDESFARGWMLRDAGRIVGFFGSLPLRVQLGGHETTAFSGSSWRVLADYRGQSLGLKLKQLHAHRDAAHFSTTPREDLLPLLERLGYRPLRRGPGTDTQSQFICDGERFLRPKLPSVLAGAGVAAVAAPLFAAVQALRTRSLWGAARDDVRELPRADAAFDELWHRTRTRWANTNVRTAAVVNWYCFAVHPAEKRLLAYFDGGELAAYMILWMRQDADRRLLECVDLWTDPARDEARALRALVAAAADVARRERFERVLFPHFHPRLVALYGELGLLSGPAWRKREFVKLPAALADAVTPETSYFVRAQGDYGM